MLSRQISRLAGVRLRRVARGLFAAISRIELGAGGGAIAGDRELVDVVDLLASSLVKRREAVEIYSDTHCAVLGTTERHIALDGGDSASGGEAGHRTVADSVIGEGRFNGEARGSSCSAGALRVDAGSSEKREQAEHGAE